MDDKKVIENYTKICEFLLAKAASTPVGTCMNVNLKRFVGHYATVEIEHESGRKAYLRVYDSPDLHGHSPQNYFYAGDDLEKIRKTIFSDRPTMDLMKNFVIGWHRYGIKELILSSLNRAVVEANEKLNEKLEAEKEIDNFVV